MCEIIINIGIHIFLFILGTIGFVVSFHFGILKKIDVFFYRGLFLILIWGIIVSLLMWIIKSLTTFTNVISAKDIILLFVLFCSIHTVLFTHLPVTAERSISVFMLGYMTDNKDKEFTEKEIEDIFKNIYVDKYEAFKKRFHEQEVTGTIKQIENGKYQITKNGISLMKMYEWISKIFNVNQELIHPDCNKGDES